MLHRMAPKEWWSQVLQDVRLSLRQLRRRPGFALVAVCTLAIGIGATTAIFSAADQVLLRPLPYADADRVVRVFETDRTGQRLEAAPANFLSWRERSHAFSAIALAEPTSFDVVTEGRPEPVPAWMVTEGYFEALGVQPILGRGFVRDEHPPGLAEGDLARAAAVVVISHRMWRDRFGGDPAIVGSTIDLNGTQRTIVGVLPPSLDYPRPVDIWAPKIFRPYELQERTGGYMEAVGRLAPGITLEAAQGDMDRIATELAAEFPATNENFGITLVRLEDHVLGGVRPALWALFGAVGLVLLIACANVSSLLLARRAERERELAVRTAIGAGRSRLVRQLLTENAVIALVGGVFGLLLAAGAVHAFVAVNPSDMPRLDTLAIDARALLFAFAMTSGTALLFGLAPALQFSAPELQAGLGSGARAVGGGGRHRLRRVLVAGEIAIALVLLIGAGLLGRSFLQLLSNDLGFAVENRAEIQFSVVGRATTAEELIVLARQHQAQLAGLPGVEDVAMVSALPFHPIQIDNQGTFQIEGLPLPAGAAPRAQTTLASPNYFRVMEIPLRAGRAFTDQDRSGTPNVAIINETMARTYFGAENPIGKRLTIGVMGPPRAREIVGVVGDVRPTTLDSDPRAELYIPFEQRGFASMTYVVRTRGPASAIVPRMREAVWVTDPSQAIRHSDTLDRLVADTLVERRFNLMLLGAFSLIALALSLVGVYGLIRFITEQRRGEIGLRMALGARRADVTRMIVSDALRLVLPGIVLGTLGALALTRFLRALLYGVTPTDPMTFVQIATVMFVVAVGAAYLPAARAASTDPMRVLREE
jgi:putative ABC transport system permease protein